jgi:hypothetical protein
MLLRIRHAIYRQALFSRTANYTNPALPPTLEPAVKHFINTL